MIENTLELTGIIQSDDGRTNTHGHLHDLDDLLCVCLAERTTKDGEI